MGRPRGTQRSGLDEVAVDESFEAFVVAHASTLVGLAAIITADPEVARQAADDAWLQVHRSWPRIDGSRHVLASAAAPFVSEAVRRAGPDRTPSSGGLELLDHGIADAGTVLEGSPVVASLDEALLDLSPRERAAVALRWYVGLDDHDLVRAMRLRPLRPDRLADRACADMLYTAMLQPTGPAVPTGTAGEFRALLRVALDELASTPVDGPEELARLRPRTAGLRQRRPRVFHGRRLVLAVAGVATALTAALLAVTVLQPSGDREQARAGPPARPPVAPAGSRLVGYRTVYVTVPGSWSHNRVECGNPVENTVIYPDATQRCDPKRVPAVDVPISSVRFSSPPTSPVPLGELRQINEVGGSVVFSTTPERRQGLLHQVLVVLQAHVLIDVRTPDERVLDDIVDSLKAVPHGYTVVPSVVGHPVNESLGLLDAAGLKVGGLYVELLPGARRSLQPTPLVTRQSVAPGAIVPVGSSVGLAFPGYN